MCERLVLCGRGRRVLRCISQISCAASALPVFPPSVLFDLPSARPQQAGSNGEAFCATRAGVLKMMTMAISKPGICCLNSELQSALIHNQSLCFARRFF